MKVITVNANAHVLPRRITRRDPNRSEKNLGLGVVTNCIDRNFLSDSRRMSMLMNKFGYSDIGAGNFVAGRTAILAVAGINVRHRAS